MRLFNFLILCFVTFNAFSATKISSGDIILGTGAPDTHTITSKQGATNNPYIQFNSVSGKWEFTNDGVLIKDIGSGSGGGGVGGVNLLANNSFEDNVTDGWTANSVTPSQEQFTNAATGDENFARMDFDAASDYFESALYDKPDFFDVGCSAVFDYKGGDTNIDVVIIDGSANEIYREALIAKTDWTQISPIQFPCASQMKIRFEATADAAVLDIDKVYLGSVLGISDIAFTDVAGSSFFAATANCAWQTTATSLSAIPVDNDCPGPTIQQQNVGSWQTTDANLPQQTINDLPAGRYLVRVKASFYNSTTARVNMAITDGTNTSRSCGSYNQAANYGSLTVCELLVDYLTAGNRTFSILAAASAGTTTLSNGAQTNDNEIQFTVLKYPLESVKTFLPKTQGFIYEGYITTSSSYSLAASTPNYSFAEGSANLSLTNVRGTGKIACASGTAPTGTTCSSNESIGVAVDLPSSGLYEVCFNPNFNINNGTSTYKIAHVDVNNNVILDGNVTGNKRDTNSDDASPGSICDTFDISSAGEKLFKVRYIANGGLTLAVTNTAIGDERRTFWRIKKIAQNVSAPILVGGQIFDPTPSAKRLKKYTLIFGGAGEGDSCTASPCTIIKETNDWINGNITRSSTGEYLFASNAVFQPNEELECHCTPNATNSSQTSCFIGADTGLGSPFKANGSGIISFTAAQTSRLYTRNASGSAVDSRVSFTCYGEE